MSGFIKLLVRLLLSKLVIKWIHLLSACSLLSAEFGAVLEGFLFSTYAGVYKSMPFWPHPFYVKRLFCVRRLFCCCQVS